MNGEAVREIRELAEAAIEPRVVAYEGEMFLAGEVSDPRKKEPEPSPLIVGTLTSFVRYVLDNLDGLGSKVFVHVRSPIEVALVSPLHGRFQQRFEYLVAQAPDFPGELSFAYGTFLPAESMLIALQALFKDSEDRPRVLRLLGTIREDSIRTSKDDGVTQQVTAAAGITLSEEVEVPNPVNLRPFRTFLEVDQPASRFVLRVRMEKGPVVALFHADGGAWKLEAVKSIRDYLAAELVDVDVIA